MKAGLVKLHLFLSVSRLSRKGAASSPTPGLACTPEGSHWGNAPSSRPAAKLAQGAVKPDTPRHSPRSQASATQDKEARTGASLCRTETNRENSDVFHRDKPALRVDPASFCCASFPATRGLRTLPPRPMFLSEVSPDPAPRAPQGARDVERPLRRAKGLRVCACRGESGLLNCR